MSEGSDHHKFRLLKNTEPLGNLAVHQDVPLHVRIREVQFIVIIILFHHQMPKVLLHRQKCLQVNIIVFPFRY